MTAAFTLDGARVSREAFYAVACDPQRSVVVEACAGAGKTWMLVSRILRALLDGAQPHEILAITFTRKAAGEMRARLDEWLAEFGAGCDEVHRVQALRDRGLGDAQARALAPRLAALQETVLRSGRSVEVRTFHAWFSQLLRVAPLELLAEVGLRRDTDLVEDPSEHAAAVHRAFHAKVAADESLRADYEQMVRTRGRSQLRKWLDGVLERRIEIELADAAGTLDNSVAPASAVWPEFAAFEHPGEGIRAADVLAMLGALAIALGRSSKAIPQKQAAKLQDALGLTEHGRCLEGVRAALFTDKGTLRKGLDAPGVDEAVERIERIDRACAQHEAHLEHRRMVRLSRALLHAYAHYKRSRGLADMADLERSALALLRDASLSGWVQERLDARIRHVLIDEFQDTSPLQWHALHAWLDGYGGAGGGASGQRPPGVFIVGDPKQSIYRFRRAEPRVFEAARAFVQQGLGGHALACDHTRRNAPGVIEALNEVFAQAQYEQAFSGFRPHTTEVGAADPADLPALRLLPRVERMAGSGSAASRSSGWRDTLTTPRHEPDEVLRQQEAAAVARAVHELVALRGLMPGEIHVLCRKRESLRLVADELAALHVPFAASEDFALMESPEARDLVALLDVLASSQHRLSLAHALRSPLFGAGDDDLVALARAAAPHGDWWATLMQIGDAAAEPLRRAASLLARWQSAARRLPPHDLLDLIVSEGDVVARYAAAVPAERRRAALAAIDALLAQALVLDGARYATPYGFVRALKRRRVKVSAAASPDGVQLLTVHGAKGLEARVVFVMDADPSPKNTETATLLVDWPVESGHPRCCAFVYSEARCPPALQEVLATELQARDREELNGLYVAMSRARRQLVFSATAPHRVPPRASWWARVEALGTRWVPVPVPHQAALAGEILIDTLPAWRHRPPAIAAPLASADDEATRFGKALHRVLEWIARPGVDGARLPALAIAAAAEFAAVAADVERVSSAIWHSPACARFFRGPALQWAGNEVPLSDEGELLRIDRLVALHHEGVLQWWILDYKLSARPQQIAENREQLARYRRALARVQPAAVIRCAFITGRGELVEVD